MAVPDYCALLAEAEAAYHSLITGKQVVEFRDQNGEMVKYGSAKAGDLLTYINGLRNLCNNTVLRNAPRPIGFLF